jgi:hypothetical protein
MSELYMAHLHNPSAAFDGVDAIEWDTLTEYATLEPRAYKLGPEYRQRVHQAGSVFVD